jgi:hypothetical protein
MGRQLMRQQVGSTVDKHFDRRTAVRAFSVLQHMRSTG